MAISFNEVPSTARVPFVYVEFDSSNAQQGPAIQTYRALIMGQKLSSGTKSELTMNRVTSKSQAKEYFGAGSQLAEMVEAFLDNNSITEIQAIPIDDLSAGVAAAGTVTFAGTATEAGTLYFYIGGKQYSIAVASGDTAAEVCAALVAEIQDDDDRIVTAAVDGSVDEEMDLTARHKGENGNQIDLRFNYYYGNETPAGITATIVDMSGGTGNPDIDEIIAAIGDEQFHIIVNPWTDASNLTSLETELQDRWGPIRQNDGQAFCAKSDSHANLTTLGESRNSEHVNIMGVVGPTLSWRMAAMVAGQVAKSAQNDPARPFQTLRLVGALAPEETERFTLEERNLLLYSGISTFYVNAGGTVHIERLITTYRQNDFGADDTAYLDVTTPLTLSYLRYDFRTSFQVQFPRHKLADDGTRFGPGQVIVTPKIAKAWAVGKFQAWEELGLVENVDQFKRDLVVERNSSNPNRLDFLLPPDLVNQLMIVGAQFQFLL